MSIGNASPGGTEGSVRPCCLSQVCHSPGGSVRLAGANTEAAADGAKNGFVSRQVADSVTARVVKAPGGKLPSISFQIVETAESLPEPIRAYAAAQKVRKPRGVCSEGVVQMVLSSHMSAKEVKKTVFHELHGHAGLDKLYVNTITRRSTTFWTLSGDGVLLKLAVKY